MFRRLKVWQKESRVRAALGVAMVFSNHRGEILLVMKNGKLTIPTGHMKLGVDRDIVDTLGRESREELWKKSLEKLEPDPYKIIAWLGTVQRNINDSLKSKSFDAVYSKMSRKAAEFVEYEEKEQRGHIWVKAPSEKELLDLSIIIDELAQEALRRYAKMFLARFRGGENGAKDFTLVAETSEASLEI